jgi:hypothetical protein
MRKFSIAVSALGALLMLSAAGAAQAYTGPHIKPDATPACGDNCFNLFSLAYGHHEIQSANVPGDDGVGGKVGQTINLNNATDSSPNEDFTVGYAGTVAQLCSEDQLSPYICNFYGTSSKYDGAFPVYESDWSPYGNESGLCAGVARPATAGENVTLQECGVSSATFWVADLSHSYLGFTPFLNGADTTFTHPLVLTVVTSKSIGKRLRLERLNLLTGGYIPNEQMWALNFGIEL